MRCSSFQKLHFACSPNILVLSGLIGMPIFPVVVRAQPAQEIIVAVTEMNRSPATSPRNDYVMLWGRGKKDYVWLEYDLSALPFLSFHLEVEAAAARGDSLAYGRGL